MITENRDDHEKLDVRGNEIEDVNLNKKQVFVFFRGPGVYQYVYCKPISVRFITVIIL